MTRLVVVGVALVVAVAAADSLRRLGGPEAATSRKPEARVTRWRIDRGPTPCRSLVPGACGRYRVLDGAISRDGEPFLGRKELAGSFPGAPVGWVSAFRVARAPDGMLAVAVVDEHGRGAVELWHAGASTASFSVPAWSFRAGLGWSPAGDLVATYPRRGRPTLYDRRGVRVAEVAWERRPG